MWTRLLLLCSFVAAVQPAAWAQAEDPKDLLLRVRGNVTDTLTRLPKYMCSLTIDRALYGPGPAHPPSCDALVAQQNKGQLKPRLAETDRLRLDVASGAASEMYSWVGEDRFDDRDLFQIVRTGALQTGSFSIFLSSIFDRNAASFSYNGETAVDGRTLVEFGFQVPLEKSNYVFGNRREHVTTAYEGTFLADPKTGDLVRLMVRTSELPVDVGSCQASTTLNYARVHLHDSEFLLPREAQLDILNTDGSDWRNRTVFSSCHEFLGESTLKFDEPSPQASAGAPGQASAPRPFALPAGLPFKLLFTQPIDADTAAAGDRIKAKLTTAIRDVSSQTVLVPEGSEVVARIVRLEHFTGPPASVKILVKLKTVNVGGTPLPFTATMNGAVQRFSNDGRLQPRIQLGSFDTLGDPGSGVFEFRDVKPKFVVKSGLESAWLTAETR